MRAMGFNRHGGADVMEIIEVDDPAPSDNEVMIRLIGTSVNRLDILAREGVHGMPMSMPHIPGTDIIGTIEKTGKAVKGFSEGETVISNTVYGCGSCDKCRAGEENLCAQWKCVGLQVDGSYGEMVCVPERLLSRPPKAYPNSELAAMPHSLPVAWRALHTLGKAREGESVLIRGASGNTGIFSVMLAKAMGLRIIAMSRSRQKAQRLKSLGAGHVLDTNAAQETIREEVMSITNGRGADIVLETSGSTLGDSVGLSAYSARIVVFGTIQGPVSEIIIKRLYLWNACITGTHNASKKEFDEAFGFASRNGIRPIIAATMPIEEAANAQRALEQSRHFGKIVLKHW